jgi:hypothetical protein
LPLIYLVATEQFGVVSEVPQEPIELPQGFRTAIEAARDSLPCETNWLKNRQSEPVIRLLCLPLKHGSLHSDEKNSVGDLMDSAAIGVMQAGDLAFHAAPSF